MVGGLRVDFSSRLFCVRMRRLDCAFLRVRKSRASAAPGYAVMQVQRFVRRRAQRVRTLRNQMISLRPLDGGIPTSPLRSRKAASCGNALARLSSFVF